MSPHALSLSIPDFNLEVAAGVVIVIVLYPIIHPVCDRLAGYLSAWKLSLKASIAMNVDLDGIVE